MPVLASKNLDKEACLRAMEDGGCAHCAELTRALPQEETRPAPGAQRHIRKLLADPCSTDMKASVQRKAGKPPCISEL